MAVELGGFSSQPVKPTNESLHQFGERNQSYWTQVKVQQVGHRGSTESSLTEVLWWYLLASSPVLVCCTFVHNRSNQELHTARGDIPHRRNQCKTL